MSILTISHAYSSFLLHSFPINEAVTRPHVSPVPHVNSENILVLWQKVGPTEVLAECDVFVFLEYVGLSLGNWCRTFRNNAVVSFQGRKCLHPERTKTSTASLAKPKNSHINAVRLNSYRSTNTASKTEIL